MKKWNIYARVIGSKYLGAVEAKTKEEALDKADKEFREDMWVNLCYQCSDEIDDAQIDDIIAEEYED